MFTGFLTGPEACAARSIAVVNCYRCWAYAVSDANMIELGSQFEAGSADETVSGSRRGVVKQPQFQPQTTGQPDSPVPATDPVTQTATVTGLTGIVQSQSLLQIR
jgi:hypothetical protein